MGTLLGAVAALAAAGVVGEVKESAFGFDKGMTLRQVKAVLSLRRAPHDPYLFIAQGAPRPVAPFTMYAIMVGPQTGVCMVMAQTEHWPEVERTKIDYANIVKMLVARYGPPRERTSAQESEDEWLQPQGPETKLRLEMQKNADGTTHVVLSYLFSNMLTCIQEARGGL